MEADLFLPDGQGPFPCVMLLHGSAGIHTWIQEYAGQLAKAGYICLVPHYFEAFGITDETRSLSTTKFAEQTLADFESLSAHLQKLPQAAPNRIAIVGFSMGGYWAPVLAGKSKVACGVAYYPAVTGGGKNLALEFRLSPLFEKTSAPVLIFHGEKDSVVRFPLVQKLVMDIEKTGAPHETKFYSEADHAFNVKDRDGQAAKDAAERTKTFLHDHL